MVKHFLEPKTRVFVGRNFEIPATITNVTLRSCGCPIYLVEWWVDSEHYETHLDRCDFSLEQGIPGVANDLIEYRSDD